VVSCIEATHHPATCAKRQPNAQWIQPLYARMLGGVSRPEDVILKPYNQCSMLLGGGRHGYGLLSAILEQINHSRRMENHEEKLFS